MIIGMDTNVKMHFVYDLFTRIIKKVDSFERLIWLGRLGMGEDKVSFLVVIGRWCGWGCVGGWIANILCVLG